MFSTRNIIYLALTFSLCGLIGIYFVLSSQVVAQTKDSAVVEPKVAVLSLNTALKQGRKLQLKQLTWLQLPQSQADQLIGYINRKDFNQQRFLNAIARRDLNADAVIRNDDLISTNEPGYFAASLAKNMRAVAIKVDPQSAIAGLIQPGDHVDVLLFHELQRNSDQDKWLIASSSSVKTLISNVRLMALDDSASKQQEASQTSYKDKFSKQSTVTLEVTSIQAEQLAVAERIGKLSLVLRSLDSDQPTTNNRQTTFDSILPNYKNKTEQANMILMKGDNKLIASTKQDEEGSN